MCVKSSDQDMYQSKYIIPAPRAKAINLGSVSVPLSCCVEGKQHRHARVGTVVNWRLRFDGRPKRTCHCDMLMQIVNRRPKTSTFFNLFNEPLWRNLLLQLAQHPHGITEPFGMYMAPDDDGQARVVAQAATSGRRRVWKMEFGSVGNNYMYHQRWSIGTLGMDYRIVRNIADIPIDTVLAHNTNSMFVRSSNDLGLIVISAHRPNVMQRKGYSEERKSYALHHVMRDQYITRVQSTPKSSMSIVLVSTASGRKVLLGTRSRSSEDCNITHHGVFILREFDAAHSVKYLTQTHHYIVLLVDEQLMWVVDGYNGYYRDTDVYKHAIIDSTTGKDDPKRLYFSVSLLSAIDGCCGRKFTSTMHDEWDYDFLYYSTSTHVRLTDARGTPVLIVPGAHEQCLFEDIAPAGTPDKDILAIDHSLIDARLSMTWWITGGGLPIMHANGHVSDIRNAVNTVLSIIDLETRVFTWCNDTHPFSGKVIIFFPSLERVLVVGANEEHTYAWTRDSHITGVYTHTPSSELVVTLDGGDTVTHAAGWCRVGDGMVAALYPGAYMAFGGTMVTALRRYFQAQRHTLLWHLAVWACGRSNSTRLTIMNYNIPESVQIVARGLCFETFDVQRVIE